jgi:hypothetical protein
MKNAASVAKVAKNNHFALFMRAHSSKLETGGSRRMGSACDGIMACAESQARFCAKPTWSHCNVRFWHLADIDAGDEHVCFWG